MLVITAVLSTGSQSTCLMINARILLFFSFPESTFSECIFLKISLRLSISRLKHFSYFFVTLFYLLQLQVISVPWQVNMSVLGYLYYREVRNTYEWFKCCILHKSEVTQKFVFYCILLLSSTAPAFTHMFNIYFLKYSECLLCAKFSSRCCFRLWFHFSLKALQFSVFFTSLLSF